jgi:hypothetical protein
LEISRKQPRPRRLREDRKLSYAVKQGGLDKLLSPSPLATENKVDSAKNAKASPKIVEFEWLFHVIDSKRYKESERNDLLQDLELSE